MYFTEHLRATFSVNQKVVSRRCSIKKGVRKNFEQFNGRYLNQGFFLIKQQALSQGYIAIYSTFGIKLTTTHIFDQV